MDLVFLLGVAFLIVALLMLVGTVGGGWVGAIICAVIGLLILGGGINGRRGTRL